MFFMHWLFLGIVGYIFWSIVIIISKYLLIDRVKNEYVYILNSVFLSIFTLLILLFFPLQIPSLQLFLFIIPAAFLYLAGGIPYLRALQIEEVTRISVLWNLIPLFSLGLGYVLFGVSLSSREMLGLLLLVFGAIIASFHRDVLRMRFSKGFWLMLISTLCYALYGVLIHQISDDISFISSYFWLQLCMVAIALVSLLFPSLRRSFITEMKSMKTSTYSMIFLNNIFDDLGILFTTWALLVAPAALVFSLEGVQAVLVFIFTYLITCFTSIDIQEDIQTSNTLLKILAILFVIAGLYFVY